MNKIKKILLPPQFLLIKMFLCFHLKQDGLTRILLADEISMSKQRLFANCSLLISITVYFFFYLDISKFESGTKNKNKKISEEIAYEKLLVNCEIWEKYNTFITKFSLINNVNFKSHLEKSKNHVY